MAQTHANTSGKTRLFAGVMTMVNYFERGCRSDEQVPEESMSRTDFMQHFHLLPIASSSTAVSTSDQMLEG
jgi:hypothetical protein